MAPIGWIPVLVLLLILQNQPSTCTIQQDADSSSSSNLENGTIAEQVIGALYDCRFHYAQLPDSCTRFSVHHLVLGQRQNNSSSSAMTDMKKIDFNVNGEHESQLQLERLDLDPQLPFVFFTNGFNHDGILDGTWMADVAKVYMSRYLTAHTGSNNNNIKGRPGANVVFLNWHMEGLVANPHTLSSVPVYYKTMANYDIIVGRFQSAIQQILDHLDALRLTAASSESRKDYYARFRFYGHSLGSHILAHALNGLYRNSLSHKRDTDLLKFDQIYGIDPAVPCFLNDQQGLTAARLNGIAREVVILHSNAGILGAFSDRGQLEIVLNGGTFQPDCSLFDINCHHVRSTEIFGYIDDNCKMVAYKCNKYEQFKLGACETCDTPVAFSSIIGDNENKSKPTTSAIGASTQNCVLVNLEQQNEDNELIKSIAALNGQQVRQLADNEGDGNDVYDFERATSIGLTLAMGIIEKQTDEVRNAKQEYHFVNTNPKFREIPTKSHCLQHYQVRLLTLDIQSSGNSIEPAPKCALKLLYGDGISVKLFQESSRGSNLKDWRTSVSQRDQPTELKLTTIIENQLHTGLGTFSGKPQLFVGALIDNIDLNSWSECFVGHQKPNKPAKEFVLDIAFMSHTRDSVRHAFSSVLCARWPSRPSEANVTTAATTTTGHLILNLCRQSELATVSNRIDQLIRQVKFHNQFEPWHVILLNSLFSLFTGWEPLKKI